MTNYYNVTVTVQAKSKEEAESIVERGIDKQGYSIIDIYTDRVKIDEDLEGEV